MSLLDDEDDLVNNDSALLPYIVKKKLSEILVPLLDKLKGGATDRMPRIAIEVSSEYIYKYIGTCGIEKQSTIKVNFANIISEILKENGEKELSEYITHIDSRKVDRMGIAVDFVITALNAKNPIILIENINELPECTRRDDIEAVLIHSWAKDNFVFLDNVYDTRPHIVIFTTKPKCEIGECNNPVSYDNDGYKWYGNILKDDLIECIIDADLFNETLNTYNNKK